MGASTRSGGRTEAGPGATASSPASSDAPSIQVRGHAGPKTGDVVGEPFGKPSPNRVGDRERGTRPIGLVTPKRQRSEAGASRSIISLIRFPAGT